MTTDNRSSPPEATGGGLAGLSLLAGRGIGIRDRDVRQRRRIGMNGCAVLLCAAYPLLAVAPMIALTVINPDGGHPTGAAVGINCALVGFTLLSLQFLLTARLSWIESPFGLDLLLVFHRAMALVIVPLLCVHPLLIAAAEGWPLLFRLHARWYLWAGRIALVLLVAQVGAALLRRWIRLSYETWRRTHNAIALSILALGLAHSLTVGDDLDGGAKALWLVTPIFGFLIWSYSRIVRPRLLARRAFRVSSVRPEAPRVWTVRLEAPAGRPFRFSPGQFQFVRLLGSGAAAQEHPFSIASSPVQADHISLTIKACGDFTSTINRIKPGDFAAVHGPFGRFSCDLHDDECEMVFVAGGVGITPLMSMLRAMRDRRQARRVTLIYANRDVDDILFRPELAEMETGQCPALRVIYVLSQPPNGWSGKTGRVDAKRLEEWCHGFDDKSFYLCCPARMTKELVRGLRRKSVSPRRIHCDYFSL